MQLVQVCVISKLIQTDLEEKQQLPHLLQTPKIYYGYYGLLCFHYYVCYAGTTKRQQLQKIACWFIYILCTRSISTSIGPHQVKDYITRNKMQINSQILYSTNLLTNNNYKLQLEDFQLKWISWIHVAVQVWLQSFDQQCFLDTAVKIAICLVNSFETFQEIIL